MPRLWHVAPQSRTPPEKPGWSVVRIDSIRFAVEKLGFAIATAAWGVDLEDIAWFHLRLANMAQFFSGPV